MNDRSFEHCERTLEELKMLFSMLCIFRHHLLFILW